MIPLFIEKVEKRDGDRVATVRALTEKQATELSSKLAQTRIDAEVQFRQDFATPNLLNDMIFGEVLEQMLAAERRYYFDQNDCRQSTIPINGEQRYREGSLLYI